MCVVYKKIRNRILIIDDDIDLLMVLERRLDREGFSVETAVTLAAAEEMIEVFEPHLILSDINVNGEDGRTLCWKLKMVYPPSEIKVIMMSGYDVSPARAALFGADDMLPKPLNTEYLLNRLDFHLNSGQPESVHFLLQTEEDETEN